MQKMQKTEQCPPKVRKFLWVVNLLALVFLLVSLHFFLARRPVTVSFLDVGQGDACLIRAGRGGNALIDGGDEGEGRTLQEALRLQNVRKLDAVFLSHFHADHQSGIIELMQDGFPIEVLYLPAFSEGDAQETAFLDAAERAGIRTERLSAGQELSVGKMQYRVLWPDEKANVMTTNNRSLVLRAEYGENHILFTGDTETSAQAELAECAGELLSAQILKVPHHGGKTSVYSPFLELCRPQIALIGVAENNRHGHPSQEMLTALQEAGCKVFRTDACGTIQIVLDQTKVKRVGTTEAKWRKLR